MKYKIAFAALVIVLAVVGYYRTKKPDYKNLQQPNTSATVHDQTPNDVVDLRKNVTELDNLIVQQNPKVALAELASRMKTDHVVFKNCHAIAHEMGHQAYKKYQDFIVALNYQDSVCSDGYLHGVLEERFFDSTSETNVLKDMLSICNGTGVSSGRCYHGVGHGLMFYYNNDLPKAIAACETYPDSSARGRCYEGVYMQNFLADPSSPLVHPSKYVDVNNAFYPCPVQSAHLKPFCYFYAPILFLDLHNNDYVAAIKWCNTAEVAGLGACVRGVGSLGMKYNIDNPKFVESVCDQASSKLIASCIDGLVSYYLTYYDHLSLAKQMCTQMAVKNQPACNDAVARRNGVFVD